MKIVAEMPDGTVQEFVLVKQEPDVLVGGGVRLAVADIAKLKVERISQWRTATVSAMAGFIVGFIALAIAVSHSDTGT